MVSNRRSVQCVMWKQFKRRGCRWRNKAEQRTIKDDSSRWQAGDSNENEASFSELKTQSLLCVHRNEWQSKWRKIRRTKLTERKLFSRFQVLSTVLLWNQVLRDVKLCSWGEWLRTFRKNVMPSSSRCRQSFSSKLGKGFTPLHSVTSQRNLFPPKSLS